MYMLYVYYCVGMCISLRYLRKCHYTYVLFFTLPVAIFLITIVMEEGQAEFKETVLTLTKTK